MSWLARSLATSLRLEGDEAEDEQEHNGPTTDSASSPPLSSRREQLQEQSDPSRGVKEDLSELKRTLSRQFWGVASFLAPPPTPSRSQAVGGDTEWDRLQLPNKCSSAELAEADQVSDSHGDTMVGTDFLRSCETRLSRITESDLNINSHGVEEDEIGKLEEEGEVGSGAVGVTEEVLAFARNIAMHPETWLDYPIDEEDDTDDFDMSEAQREHVWAIEQLAPRLAALRIELCPAHMSEGYFWKVYFVLVHSRLSKHDSKFLSTFQVMEARAMWMKELRKQTKEKTSLRTFCHPRNHHFLACTDAPMVDKAVIEEKPAVKITDKHLSVGPSFKSTAAHSLEDDGDDWLKDENLDLGGYRGTASEEDVSFSDLEEEGDCYSAAPVRSKMGTKP